MSSKDLFEKERKFAAIHEAAHEVLIHYLGGLANASIWPNAESAEDLKSWRGRCALIREPGQVRFPAGIRVRLGVIRKTPKLWRRYVGLAGFVAEQLFDGREKSWEILEAYEFARDAGEISCSDLELIGELVRERDIARTICYLTTLRDAIERRAKHLIEASM